MPKRKRPPLPDELFFMLADSVMARLSANAWKVVSYIATQHMRVQDEYFLRHTSPPAIWALNRDIERVTGMNMDKVSGEVRPYRPGGPALPWGVPPRFAVLSLAQICVGMRVKNRWQDHGTGLSKSSAAEAINEAIAKGIVVREHAKGSTGGNHASRYAIDWDRVQELDWHRRKMEKAKTRHRKRRGKVSANWTR